MLRVFEYFCVDFCQNNFATLSVLVLAISFSLRISAALDNMKTTYFPTLSYAGNAKKVPFSGGSSLYSQPQVVPPGAELQLTHTLLH